MFLSGCTNENKNIGTAGLNFSPEDISFLDEVGDTIIPATDTPGAKDAKIGDFMHTIVRDCYDENRQRYFVDGMGTLNQASKQKNGKYFLESSPAERKDLLIDLDKEQKAYTAKKKPEDPAALFPDDEGTDDLGIFHFRTRSHQGLRYIAVPGKYEGCIPYKKGDKAWAT